MALFNACICRFEKEFEVFTHYVSIEFANAIINLDNNKNTFRNIRLLPLLETNQILSDMETAWKRANKSSRNSNVEYLAKGLSYS